MAYIFISILFDFRMQIIQPGTAGFDINGCLIARGK
jgi:hypothetical protein